MTQQWTKKRQKSLPSWIYTESSENNMCNRSQASLTAQTVKNLPAMQETWLLSLGWEDPLEKEIATHSSILAWRIPWRGAWWAKIHGVAQCVGHNWATNTTFHIRSQRKRCFGDRKKPQRRIRVWEGKKGWEAEKVAILRHHFESEVEDEKELGDK